MAAADEGGGDAALALARRWRPRRFAEVVGQKVEIETLRGSLARGRTHHAYMFTGTRGVGKTTLARILAKAFNCAALADGEPCGKCDSCQQVDAGVHPDVFEMDAASTTQVDSMREVLDSTSYAPSSGPCKVYIIDEVHMLSKAAFNAMLKTLEEPPPHVKFILATTDPQQVPATVHSRCLRFALRRLGRDELAGHLARVLEAEKIEAEPAALNLIAGAADGSVRDSLSILEEALAGGGAVAEERVRELLGLAGAEAAPRLLAALRAKDLAGAVELADGLHARGADLAQVLAALAEHVHRGQLAALFPALREDGAAPELRPADAQLVYEIAVNGRRQLLEGADAKIAFDMTLLRIGELLGTLPEPAPAPAAVKPVARPAAEPAPRPAPAPAAQAAAPVDEPAPAAAAEDAAPAGMPADAAAWQRLSGQVDARAQALAQQCAFVGADAAAGVLRLATEATKLLTQQDRLLRSLAAITGGAVKEIVFGAAPAAAAATPAQARASEERARHAAAVASIEQGPALAKIRERYPNSTVGELEE
ncbi:MAG: DNA polymerase III subunit gamma/tau [Betaproteobacteria bacterium AqS2]|uniref:DNA polymerase III subunit gamma/tau n=1 Tax=Candidatus Amphirhobacter heronislandensis TaxID=1732024 RepID=A0A930UD97_9GAMM|nr:DNA polymerase III subunit gamma/tau [Betaproteobacteria bacterium AqS2]